MHVPSGTCYGVTFEEYCRTVKSAKREGVFWAIKKGKANSLFLYFASSWPSPSAINFISTQYMDEARRVQGNPSHDLGQPQCWGFAFRGLVKHASEIFSQLRYKYITSAPTRRLKTESIKSTRRRPLHFICSFSMSRGGEVELWHCEKFILTSRIEGVKTTLGKLGLFCWGAKLTTGCQQGTNVPSLARLPEIFNHLPTELTISG